ncbi:hypothetical protein [Salinisphaera sp. S4-8]|uniref:hypothetical protein n=1 Tax=Salinisphaera sp. S4-8 TaxID=633357 RepID=UPI0033426172
MLDFRVLYRPGNESGGCKVRESYSCDFTIDGNSLLKAIIRAAGDHKDFLGCFARGWTNLNEHSLKQLLLKERPETESGRSLIYVCPECADIGCGAYGCKITKSGGTYVWSDFAYENGYEEPDPIAGLGPFEFSADNYEKVIGEAYAL